jgi:hypothetical protein
MVPSFMRSGVHVDILQFLQRRVKMATNDVRRRNGSSRPSAEQKARFSVADELFEEGRNRRGVNINLAKAIRCFESLFDPAVMNLLLDENGQKIGRDVSQSLRRSGWRRTIQILPPSCGAHKECASWTQRRANTLRWLRNRRASQVGELQL